MPARRLVGREESLNQGEAAGFSTVSPIMLDTTVIALGADGCKLERTIDGVGDFEFGSALHCLSGIAVSVWLDLEAK